MDQNQSMKVLKRKTNYIKKSRLRINLTSKKQLRLSNSQRST